MKVFALTLKQLSKLHERYSGKWEEKVDENDIIYAAHALDPRVKFLLIQEKYGAEGAPLIIQRVKDFCRANWPAPPSNIELDNIFIAQECPPGVSIHHHAQMERVRRLQEAATPAIAGDEWDRYFDSYNVISRDHTDQDWVLKWFKANGDDWPTVSKAIRAIYAVPPAEVDVERRFSIRRDLLGIRRALMSGDTMRIIQLLKSHFDTIDQECVARKKALQERHQSQLAVSGNGVTFTAIYVLIYVLAPTSESIIRVQDGGNEGGVYSGESVRLALIIAFELTTQAS